MTRILFVCLGNICRSPMAEGVFRKVAEDSGLAALEIDSAGTGSWHVGSSPDDRACAAAAGRGYDISGLQARQVTPADLDAYDLILAMDRSNLSSLHAMAPAEGRGRIRLFLDFAADTGISEVPDPYYGGEDGFVHVLDLIENASQGLAAYLMESSSNSSSVT